MITPTDDNPVADRTKLRQLTTRIMPYCVYMLDGNLACLGGSSTGSAGWVSQPCLESREGSVKGLCRA